MFGSCSYGKPTSLQSMLARTIATKIINLPLLDWGLMNTTNEFKTYQYLTTIVILVK